MKRICFLFMILIAFGQAEAQDKVDFLRTKVDGNRNIVDARLRISQSLNIPRGASWSLNGAKDSIGYVMFNTTLQRFGVYHGSGVWKAYALSQDVDSLYLNKADKSTLLNINGVAQDISTSRTWTIPTVTALSALTDVYLTTLSNNQLLKFDADSNKWTNWTPIFAPVSGSVNYIQNQDSVTQTAKFKISGIGEFVNSLDTLQRSLIKLRTTGTNALTSIEFTNASNNSFTISQASGSPPEDWLVHPNLEFPITNGSSIKSQEDLVIDTDGNLYLAAQGGTMSFWVGDLGSSGAFMTFSGSGLNIPYGDLTIPGYFTSDGGSSSGYALLSKRYSSGSLSGQPQGIVEMQSMGTLSGGLTYFNSDWKMYSHPVNGGLENGRLVFSWAGDNGIYSTKFSLNQNSELTLGQYTLPGIDGTSGQVLTTNGSGVVTWQPAGTSLSLGAVGSTPNSNGMTLSSGVLNLQPANATNGGALSTLAQTIAGDKSFTGIMAVSSKVNIGSPPGTLGALNTGQDGVYSYRNGDANRYIRFNAAGTFNDFLSFGAKLVINFAFSGTAQDVSFFEGNAAHGGTVKIGNNATTTSRLNVKGSTTNSSAWAGRFYNSGDAELLGIRNDGTLNLFGGSTLIPPASPVAITLPATAGTLVTSATAVPYTGANANVELTTFNLGAGNATFRGQLRSYRAVYSRVHTLSSNTTITENHHTVFADANAAAFTVILLAANSSQIWDATEKVGVTYIIKKIDSSANAVTVQGIVDGVTNPTLTTQYQSIMIQNDGDANTWRILSKN